MQKESISKLADLKMEIYKIFIIDIKLIRRFFPKIYFGTVMQKESIYTPFYLSYHLSGTYDEAKNISLVEVNQAIIFQIYSYQFLKK